MGGHRAPGAGGSDADLVDGPVDLAAVRADDALIDALAGGARAHGSGYGFGADPDDDQLAVILASWRADIEADPMPELVTLDEASEAVAAGHESRDRLRSRAKRRMPFAIAAAATVVACAGLTVAVHGAMPGDTLWGVSKVFFSERAESVERVEEVRGHIVAANDALVRGDTNAARAQLEQANVVLPRVAPEQQVPLVVERDRVRTSLEADPAPSPAEPPAATTPDTGSTTGEAEETPSPTPDPTTSDDVTPADPAETPTADPETRDASETTTPVPPPPPGG